MASQAKPRGRRESHRMKRGNAMRDRRGTQLRERGRKRHFVDIFLPQAIIAAAAAAATAAVIPAAVLQCFCK